MNYVNDRRQRKNLMRKTLVAKNVNNTDFSYALNHNAFSTLIFGDASLIFTSAIFARNDLTLNCLK